MRNIWFGMCLALIVICVCAMSLTIYAREMRKSEIDAYLSQAMKFTMKEMQEGKYDSGDKVLEGLEKYMKIYRKNTIYANTDILIIDINKGLIAIKLEERYKRFLEKDGKVSSLKTIIVDREDEKCNSDIKKIKYYITDNEKNKKLYREYCLHEGDKIICPKELPKEQLQQKSFVGWSDIYGRMVERTITNVSGDMEFYAVYR